jgi:subtilisin family serine protease
MREVAPRWKPSGIPGRKSGSWRAGAFLLFCVYAGLGPAQTTNLSRAVHLSNGHAIQRNGVTPQPPPDLALTDLRLPAATYYVVQCTGPLNHAWFDELARHGAQVIAYLPDYAVVVKTTHDRLADIAGLEFVSWSWPFEPVCKVQDTLLDLDQPNPLLVVPFPGPDADSLASVITGLGITVEMVSGSTISVTADRAGLARLAALDAVEWIQLAGEAVPFNVNVQWVVQTGWQATVPPDSSGRRIWRKGLKGQGVILGIVDTGLYTDHDMFVDPFVPIRAPGIYLHHRKVVAYKLYGRASFGDTANGLYVYHGTHVTGTAAGSDSETGDTSTLDGIAPDARICFLDVAKNGIVMDDDMTALFDSVYLGRGTGSHVLQTSLSVGWPNQGARYLQQDATADAAQWHYPDLLTIVAAGNPDSVFYQVRNPGNAKNLLTVGGCGNGIGSDTFYLHSCCGPTKDHRIKPEIVAPAIAVWSANGGAPDAYSAQDGTSFAAPAVNGACALIREYLAEGWYPGGFKGSGPGIADPSSALMRALAVVSTDPNVAVNGAPPAVPDSSIGWGRIDLDSVLYFSGDSRKLRLVDDAFGLATGESRDYTLHVTTNMPLRACLAWTDTAAMPNAETTLVNNLDLELHSPSGQNFLGNQYSGGQSSYNPHDTDALNNTECFRLNNAETGTWRVRVRARNVFTRRQPFALVVTGACDSFLGFADRPARPGAASVQLIGNPTTEPAQFRCVLPRLEPVMASVFDQSGQLVRPLVRTRLPEGSHVLRWDLLDHRGVRVNPGIYFLRVEIGGEDFTRKLVIAR